MIYFTVGPSQVYPTLNKHILKAINEDIPSLNHRGKEFKNLFQDTTSKLKTLLSIPEDFQIFFVSSALESMERIIQSCVEKCSYHVATGAFGSTWAKIATQLGKKTLKIDAEKGEGIDVGDLKIPSKAEIICLTQNDTSTGVWLPMEDIYKLKKKYPEKLLATDVVSSIPYVDIDFKFIDIAFFSVQKGFGLPAGLGVIIVSPKALEKTSVGSFHSFKNLSEKAKDFQTPETPNVFNIYLLNRVVSDMLKVGLPKIRKQTNEKAQLIYKFFNNHKKYSPFIKNLKFQSPTTIVIDVSGESESLRNKLSKKGVLIGSGYGENKLNHIRIANFPSHKVEGVKLMLKFISN